MADNQLEDFIGGLPKVELHVHIEGTLEPDVMMSVADRNGLAAAQMLPEDEGDIQKCVDRIRADRLHFTDLQDFLRSYNAASGVLRHEQDFFDLMSAYIQRCKADNVRYAEIFFDPQSHMQRGVEFATVINGLTKAIEAHGPAGQPEGCEHKDRPFAARMIMCFLRDWKASPQDSRVPADDSYDGLPTAMCALDASKPFIDKIVAVGLDNAETFGEPKLFADVFAAAREAGIPHAVAHAGEEGRADPYINDAIELLHVERLDHGVQTMLDDATCARVSELGLTLTVCPNSNELLKVFDHYFDGRRDVVRTMLTAGLRPCLNSDDPAYFGGYMNVNFMKAAVDNQLTRPELVTMSLNAIEGCFASDAEKAVMRQELEEYAKAQGC